MRAQFTARTSHTPLGFERVIVEHLWSRAVAIGGNRRQTHQSRTPLDQW
jgi:hypothetical protein